MSSEPSQTAMPHVVIGSVTIPVEVVSTAADIDKGLSGRKSLEASQFCTVQVLDAWNALFY
jgi:hypothetical protein